MKNEETQIAIDRFRKRVIKESRANLTKLKKNSSKTLYDSLRGVSRVNKNSISLYFEMEEYGEFQDKGVNGVGPATNDKNGNPRTVVKNGKYSYNNKMPPTKALDKWIVKKGIAPKDKNGKFISRQSLKFAIARSIFQNGIKPSLFFTKPFEKAFKSLPDELVEAYGLDIIETFISRKK